MAGCGRRWVVAAAEEGTVDLPLVEEGSSIGCALLVEKDCYGVRLWEERLWLRGDGLEERDEIGKKKTRRKGWLLWAVCGGLLWGWRGRGGRLKWQGKWRWEGLLGLLETMTRKGGGCPGLVLQERGWKLWLSGSVFLAKGRGIGFGLFLAPGRESSWWNQPGERKKIRAGGGGGPLGEDRFRSFLGFFLFCGVSPNYKMLPPPPFVCWRLLFIGKMLLGPQNWSLNFLFFVNFDFSYFFVFFENEQYQHRLKEENQWF